MFFAFHSGGEKNRYVSPKMPLPLVLTGYKDERDMSPPLDGAEYFCRLFNDPVLLQVDHLEAGKI